MAFRLSHNISNVRSKSLSPLLTLNLLIQTGTHHLHSSRCKAPRTWAVKQFTAPPHCWVPPQPYNNSSSEANATHFHEQRITHLSVCTPQVPCWFLLGAPLHAWAATSQGAVGRPVWSPASCSPFIALFISDLRTRFNAGRLLVFI